MLKIKKIEKIKKIDDKEVVKVAGQGSYECMNDCRKDGYGVLFPAYYKTKWF